MAKRIQSRRDTAANWTASNPTLADGEFGYEKDTKRLKIGDGVTAWNALAYHVPTTEEIVSVIAAMSPVELQQLATLLSQYLV